MSEGSQPPVGERRRRREAARAAELAAEQAGVSRPLSRRELRWREAEEAARLEAIATGELRIGDVQDALDRSALDRLAIGGSTATAGSAASAASAPESVSSSSPVTAASAVTTTPAATAPSRPPSRRSLRDRARDAENTAPEQPTERTATGRRPVVRTPTTAQGIRVLDATGQLTGIQPVVRPDEPSSHSPSAAAAPDHFTVELDGPVRTARDALAASSVPPSAASEHSASRQQVETAQPGAEQPAATEPPVEPPASDASSPSGATSDTAGRSASSVTSAESAAEAETTSEDSGEFTLRPQWVAISHISGATPGEAPSAVPSRRSIRTPAAEEPAPSPADPGAATPAPADDAPSSPSNPAVTLVKVAVLVVVAVILGALIWLLGSEALGDDSAAAPQPPTIVAATYLEETSAR